MRAKSRFLLLFLGLIANPICDAETRPNIILFLVDDMGWNDTSVPFAPGGTTWNAMYDTPAMESLASRGMRFTNAYAASPVCSPTRISFMTGKNPARTRFSSWIGHNMPSNSYLLSPLWQKNGLQPGDGHTTLPAILNNEGYLTAHVGKAHFGAAGTPGSDPLTLGFEVNVAGGHRGGPSGGYTGPWIKNPQLFPGLEDYPADAYLTDVLTIEAKKIISRAAKEGRPFFMNMAHYAVHTPIIGQGDPKTLGGYQAAGRPDPEEDYAS
ncbi:MAG: sulfatase-like hydrolase/transferase, partial [Planctomycetota bacterium]